MDAVRAFVSSMLGADVENLTLNCRYPLSGAGTDPDSIQDRTNVLTRGAGDDTLNFGTGVGTLIGGGGADTYVVDDPEDVVTEVEEGGLDTVYARISYDLVSGVEHLVLTGTSE